MANSSPIAARIPRTIKITLNKGLRKGSLMAFMAFNRNSSGRKSFRRNTGFTNIRGLPIVFVYRGGGCTVSMPVRGRLTYRGMSSETVNCNVPNVAISKGSPLRICGTIGRTTSENHHKRKPALIRAVSCHLAPRSSSSSSQDCHTPSRITRTGAGSPVVAFNTCLGRGNMVSSTVRGRVGSQVVGLMGRTASCTRGTPCTRTRSTLGRICTRRWKKRGVTMVSCVSTMAVTVHRRVRESSGMFILNRSMNGGNNIFGTARKLCSGFNRSHMVSAPLTRSTVTKIKVNTTVCKVHPVTRVRFTSFVVPTIGRVVSRTTHVHCHSGGS